MQPTSLIDTAQELLWKEGGSRSQQLLRQGVQVLYCTVRELRGGELTLRAMSLVYTTLLALVPLLALSFSIFKALGLHNQIQPMLLNLLEPLGSDAPEVVQTLLGFVDNIKIGVLGSIGIAMLFYTVLAMIQKVESAFNLIWKIPRTRPMGQRVSQYLVVLLLGPLAISLTLGITASLSSNTVVESLLALPGAGEGALLLGRLSPFLVICSVFAFLFLFIPNTSVRPAAAICGGLVSGLLWQSAAWGFASFVAGSGNYNAVYSSFAILIVLLIWLYIAWLVLLVGCQISFFVQHPEYLTREQHSPQLSPLERECLLLDVAVEVGRRFVKGQPPLSAERLSRQLRARPDQLSPVLDTLLRAGILAEDTEGRMLLARSPDSLPLNTLAQEAALSREGYRPRHQAVGAVQQELGLARADALGARTLADLLS